MEEKVERLLRVRGGGCLQRNVSSRHNRTGTHEPGPGGGGEEEYKENILSENKF